MRLIILSSLILTVTALRPSQYGSGSVPPPPSRASNVNTDYYQQNPNNNDFGGYPPSLDDPYDKQSVEERHAAWRAEQQQRYENLSAAEQANPRDEEGRMKLLASVSRGSIPMIFFVLIWRSVHHFELADQAFKESTKRVFVLPTVILLISNMAGFVGGIMAQTPRSKTRMKAILNLNKLVELILFFYNTSRLMIPNDFVAREIYVGRVISNFIFLLQCHVYTKVTWDSHVIRQETITPPQYGQNSQYAESRSRQEDWD